MENIIQQIIEIDKRAQQKYIDAAAYQKAAEEEVRVSIQKMENEMLLNSKSKLDAFRNSQNELLEEQTAALQSAMKEQKRMLEEIYQKNHEKWERDLFQKVLEK